MAALAQHRLSISGVTPSFVAAAGGGDTFVNNGKTTFFVAKNGSGAPITITFDDTGSTSPAGAKAFNADVDVVVPAGSEEWIGPFAADRFGSPVAVTYSGVTSLTVAQVTF